MRAPKMAALSRRPILPDEPAAELFRDVVLVLGGVFAVRGTDDETVEQVAQGLERAYRRARLRRRSSRRQHHALAPHPSIAALLRLSRRRASQP